MAGGCVYINSVEGVYVAECAHGHSGSIMGVTSFF